MKVLIVVALVAVLAALAGAGLFMLRRKGDQASAPGQADKRMARALALRVALSVGLFLAILVAYQLGWIQPSGVPLGR
jgi:flagellar basal body-associated protein FliL